MLPNIKPVDSKTKERLAREVAELKARVISTLRELKLIRFGQISLRDFEDETGVGRGATAGIEVPEGEEPSTPDLETLYLWLKGCGSSLEQLFRAPSGEFDEETLPVLRHLAFILKAKPEHWLKAAIEEKYQDLLPTPPPRKKRIIFPVQKRGAVIPPLKKT